MEQVVATWTVGVKRKLLKGYDSRVMFHINNELDRQLQEVDEILSSVNTSYDYYDTGGGSGSGDGELSITM